jgi:hypothetical protein
VTRQLWQDRLKLAHQQPTSPTAAKSATEPRPPKQTVIKYPFTTDRVVLELVSAIEYKKESVQHTYPRSACHNFKPAAVPLREWVCAASIPEVCFPQAQACAVLQYRNPWGFLRIGRLLEDLDSLAGSIAFQHW